MVRIRFQGQSAALSDRARKAFQLANQEAHRLNHREVGIEHLLLGLAKEGLSPAAKALTQTGFGLNWLRRQVEARHPAGPRGICLPGPLPYSSDLECFLDEIVSAGEARGILPLTPELVLLALVERSQGGIQHVLSHRRLRFWWLRRRLRALT